MACKGVGVVCATGSALWPVMPVLATLLENNWISVQHQHLGIIAWWLMSPAFTHPCFHHFALRLCRFFACDVSPIFWYAKLEIFQGCCGNCNAASRICATNLRSASPTQSCIIISASDNWYRHQLGKTGCFNQQYHVLPPMLFSTQLCWPLLQGGKPTQ